MHFCSSTFALWSYVNACPSVSTFLALVLLHVLAARFPEEVQRKSFFVAIGESAEKPKPQLTTHFLLRSL